MAVVVHDFPREAAVVVLVAQAATAARVEQIVDDEAFVIVIFVALSAHDPSARRLLFLKARIPGRSHRPSLLPRA
jgi:hypothetical protein